MRHLSCSENVQAEGWFSPPKRSPEVTTGSELGVHAPY